MFGVAIYPLPHPALPLRGPQARGNLRGKTAGEQLISPYSGFVELVNVGADIIRPQKPPLSFRAERRGVEESHVRGNPSCIGRSLHALRLVGMTRNDVKTVGTVVLRAANDKSLCLPGASIP